MVLHVRGQGHCSFPWGFGCSSEGGVRPSLVSLDLATMVLTFLLAWRDFQVQPFLDTRATRLHCNYGCVLASSLFCFCVSITLAFDCSVQFCLHLAGTSCLRLGSAPRFWARTLLLWGFPQLVLSGGCVWLLNSSRQLIMWWCLGHLGYYASWLSLCCVWDCKRRFRAMVPLLCRQVKSPHEQTHTCSWDPWATHGELGTVHAPTDPGPSGSAEGVSQDEQNNKQEKTYIYIYVYVYVYVCVGNLGKRVCQHPSPGSRFGSVVAATGGFRCYVFFRKEN